MTMTEYTMATRKTIERSQWIVGAAVAIGVLVFCGWATPAFSEEGRLREAQALEASKGTPKTVKMQKTEMLERVVMLAKAREVYWL